ncbi:MFS transporter [Nonomuraea angiospora]|uniref:MFS transporter n=1 Tax=Nonomuraea angiospora TaxID=46172 RepID=UPI003437C74C
MTTTLATPVRAGKAAVGALGVLALASGALESVVQPTVPLLQRELDMGPTGGALLSILLPITGALVTPLAGRFGDRYGGKRVLIRLMIVVCVGGTVSALAPGLPVLLAGQVLQGAMVGALPLSFIVVRKHLSAGESKAAIGVVSGLFVGGGMVGMLGEDDEVHAFLNFARPEPPSDVFANPEAQRDLVAAVFADAGWEVPGMLAAMHEADDVFFDGVSQIRMPRWHRGRVALAGDAAYAPSFLTGQGSSLALVGAYMLAGSLADRDHTTGLAAYEDSTREFVAANQGLVGEGGATLFPITAQALEQRNDRLRKLGTTPSAEPRPAHSALTLPEFMPRKPSAG